MIENRMKIDTRTITYIVLEWIPKWKSKFMHDFFYKSDKKKFNFSYKKVHESDEKIAMPIQFFLQNE